MVRETKFILLLGAFFVVQTGSGLVLSEEITSDKTAQAKTVQPTDIAILNGMTFSGKAGPLGKLLDIEDEWVFSNGTFASTECSTRCRYPKAPYYVRQKDGKIEFISEGHCTDKDAKIVWRGTVENNVVKGVFTWTISRWYWTVEKKFRFEGKLVTNPKSIASN